ncbi:LysR family transcriptional regulator [Pararobbsia alpina]|uniref:LysR substrate-binding domain-containing protein n=1 Tax=Pararobbsia alpina TaxID=621374 RepID=UPI0039A5356E
METTIDFRLIRQLWMFLAVAEEQHFGRAAKRLNMSQPPLTEQIKVLEQSLNLRLFERSRQGTKLSPAGAAILPAVRQFAGQAERLEQVVREIASGQSGVLRIGAITSSMLDIVPSLLSALRKSYPQVTMLVQEIDTVEGMPSLERGDLDLALVRLDGDEDYGMATMPLTEERLAVALPKDHVQAMESRVKIRALADEQFVMSARQVNPLYFDRLTAICRSHGFSPRVLREVRSIASQIAYVSCGQGVALVPASTQRLAPDNVVFRLLRERIMVRTAALAWNPHRHHPLVDFAVSWLGSRHKVGAAKP